MKKLYVIMMGMLGLCLIFAGRIAIAEEIELYLSDNYLNLIQSGTQVGEKLLNTKFVTINGEKIDLFSSSEKNLVVFVTGGCYNCQNFYPILKDWAVRYAGKMRITIVHIGQILESSVTELTFSGIKMIKNYDKVKSILDPGKEYFTYLIDEKGIVRYRFKFELSYWTFYEQIVKDFAFNEKMSPSLNEIKLGQKIDLPVITEWLQKDFNQENGKSFLLFVLNDGILSKMIRPFLIKIKKEYTGMINIGVIVDYNNKITQNAINEYHKIYGGKPPQKGDSNKLVPELYELDLPILDYQEINLYNTVERQDTASEYINFAANYFRNPPLMLVLDQNLHIVNLYSFSTNDCCGFGGIEADSVVKGLVKYLLNPGISQKN